MENNFYRFIESDGKRKVKISKSALLKFWENLGFKKMKLPGGNYTLVRITKNSIISEVGREELVQSVRNKLLVEDNVEEVWEAFLDKDYVNKINYLALKPLEEIRLNLSTEDTAFFFFRNGILKVTADKFDIVAYEDYEGYVHESQIINHDIDLNEDQPSKFDDFLRKITGQNSERYRSLTSAMGYLMHSYKDASLTKAVILVDEKLDFSGQANGGTGKSLVAKAVKYMTNAVFKDGKALNQKNNRFFYQDVGLFHRVLIIDDVNIGFEFESFYSVITGEMTVEEKFKSSYKIPFELSPKLLLTSNYMVEGSGGNSDERRRIEIEIYPHYHADLTPFDDFGERFFTDWNDQEWNRFYISMVKYCQGYIKTGIVAHIPINLAGNKLKQNTDPSFVEFADLRLVIPENQISLTLNKGILYDDYRANYPVEARNVTGIRFKKWLDEYCKFKGMDMHHYKSDSNSMIRITKLTETN